MPLITIGDGRTLPCLPGACITRLPPGRSFPPPAVVSPRSPQLRGVRRWTGDGCGRVGGGYDRRAWRFVGATSLERP
jgi:hypothetical protein